ncbi:MAG: prephenate dehydratase [Thiomargarita sp.]|nr:prephenate dehydratase [Thiomargarita sp.]
MSNKQLDELRNQIDKLDIEIQALITQRARAAQKVAEAKYAEKEKPHFYRPEREAEVVNNIIKRNRGPLANDSLILIFREIMSACLALQKPLKVAFLGPAGTYSQYAVYKHFGHKIEGIPLQTIDEVFREVEIGIAQYGVVPIENSTEGGVNQTLDCLIKTPLKICSEIALPIHHHLLAMTENLDNIKRIYAHQQSFAQCRAWLDNRIPTIERVAVNSNAEAAVYASKEEGSAAIAGKITAEIYNLKILASRIEDDVNNTTRFAILGQDQPSPTGNDKTSLLLSSPNKPGILYQMLSPFAKNNISMTHIESRPSRQDIWEYVFFVDIEGHIEDNHIGQAIRDLKRYTSLVKNLGSYPRSLS